MKNTKFINTFIVGTTRVLTGTFVLTYILGCSQTKPPEPRPIITQTTQIQSQSVIAQSMTGQSGNTATLNSLSSDEVTLLTNNKSAITNVKNHSHGKHSKFLPSTAFDFNYSGDIAGIINVFVDHDPTITAYSSTGRVRFYNINISLVNTNIRGIVDYINRTTNGSIKLVYYEKQNALRLIYDSSISVAHDALKQSQIWQDGGTPSPILSKDGVVLFPYGQYEPRITCQPLQLCDIQLQAGEAVKGIMIGDSVRWNEGDGSVPVVYSGSDDKPVPHIVLKPTYGGLNTTLLVTTDKRTYYMKLLSSETANLSRVGFYYPKEQIQQFEEKRAIAKSKDNEVLTDGPIPHIDPRNMHFNYKVSGDTDTVFKPIQVFDDGTHVYIQMSDSVRTNELPAFYVLGTDGDTLELVNFNYKRPFYIVNKLFDKGVLILGLDGNQQKVTISKITKE